MIDRARRRVFDGEIVGLGTTSGHRIVIGYWTVSPFGSFADVMIERPDGHRILIAPDDRVAGFVRETYVFDEIRVLPIRTHRSAQQLSIECSSMTCEVTTGDRSGLGRLVHLVPRRIARSPWWSTVIDPIARLTFDGVRTRGTAGQGRREWYAATDIHHVTSIRGWLDGSELGELADVWPPVRFGFSSTTRRPTAVTVRTTIEL